MQWLEFGHVLRRLMFHQGVHLSPKLVLFRNKTAVMRLRILKRIELEIRDHLLGFNLA